MKTSALTQQRNSPLARMQRLGGGAAAGEKSSGLKELAPVLPLTSLIDAFSIIVIYLLIGTQSGGLEVTVPSRMQLPLAQSGTGVEAAPVVRIEQNRFFMDDKEVRADELVAKLSALKAASKETEAEILIQADQAMTYASLDPLLRASAQAGLQKLRFAVMPKK